MEQLVEGWEHVGMNYPDFCPSVYFFQHKKIIPLAKLLGP